MITKLFYAIIFLFINNYKTEKKQQFSNQSIQQSSNLTIKNFKNKNMRTILFLIISVIISGNIAAQKLDWQERRKAADEIDVLIENYINLCELAELGKSEYNTAQVEALKALFAENAKITDRIASQTAEDGGSEVTEQSADEYTQALMARYPKGMTIKIAKLQADYSQLDQRKARIAMERQFRAKNEAGKYVLDTSDVMLHLTIDEDLEVVEITKFNTEPPPKPIKPTTDTKLIAMNDEMKLNLKKGETKTTLNLTKNDKNVKNAIYSVKKQPERGKVVLSQDGIATYTPRSTATSQNDSFEYEVCNTKGICDQATVNVLITPIGIEEGEIDYKGLHISPGIAFGAATNDSNINWGYEMRDESTFVEDIQSAGGTAIGAGLELDYYFSNNIGIGTGIQYNRFGGSFDIQDFRAEYYSELYVRDVGGADYRRIAVLQNATESYTISNIGIPLLLKFRTNPERKIGIFAHAGIQYNLISSAKYSIGATTNFIQRRFGNDTENSFNFTPDTNQDPVNVWVINYDDYVNIGGEQAAAAQIEALREQGMSVGLYELNDDNTDLDAHISLIGRVGLLYNFSQNRALQIGLQYTRATLIADQSYTLINEADADTANYNSLLKGGTGYSAFGLNIGLSMRLGGKK